MKLKWMMKKYIGMMIIIAMWSIVPVMANEITQEETSVMELRQERNSENLSFFRQRKIQNKNSTEWVTSGEYQYSVLRDGTIGIEHYTGQESDLIIPESIDGRRVTRLEIGMFSDNQNMVESVYVPASVRFIDDSFADLRNLSHIVVEEGSEGEYYTIDDVLCQTYGKDEWLVCYPLAKEGDTYIIPANINIIEYAFSKAEQFQYLRTIMIPTTVTNYIDYAFYIHQPMNIIFCYSRESQLFPTHHLFYHLGRETKLYVKKEEIGELLKRKMYVYPENSNDFTREHYGCVGTQVIVDDGTGSDTVWNHAIDMWFDYTTYGNGVCYLLDHGHVLNILEPDSNSGANFSVAVNTENGEFCTDDISLDRSRVDLMDYYGKPMYYLNRDTGQEIIASYYKGNPMTKFEIVENDGKVADVIRVNTNGQYPCMQKIKTRTTEQAYNAYYFKNIFCKVEDTSIAEVLDLGEMVPEAALTIKRAGTTTVTISAEYIDGRTYSDTFLLEVTDEQDECNKADLAKMSGVGVTEPSYVYTGKEIDVSPEVFIHGIQLVRGQDYTVTYVGDNVNAGIIENIQITGIGNYKGTRYTKAVIEPASMGIVSAKISSDLYYTGKEQEPKVELSLGERSLKVGRDYTVNFMNNVLAGSGQIVCVGKGNYKGTKKITFKIAKRVIENADRIQVQQYTGKELCPAVVVRAGGKVLSEKTDYKISYKNNRYPGKASVIIRGMGNYTGKIVRTFEIQVKTKKVCRLSVRKIGKGAVKVSWKRGDAASGYQIQNTTDRHFKRGVKVNTVKSMAKKITGLQEGKSYYFRVRMYRDVHQKKYYGEWSDAKKIRIK